VCNVKIEIQDPEINVKEIMDQIRENIRKRNYDGEINFERMNKPFLAHPNQSMEELLKEQAVMNRNWSYSADYHLTSHRKFLGRFIVFGKKVIRKCLRWYMNPVVDHQVYFNATVVRAINQLVNLTQYQNHAISELANQQADYGKELLNLRVKQSEKIAQLENSRVQLEESLANLRLQLTDRLNQFQKQLEVQSENASIDVNFTQSIRQSLQNEIDRLRSEVQEQVSRSEQEIGQLKLGTNVANNRLRRLERKLKHQTLQEEFQPVLPKSLGEAPLDFDYFLFEEYYRCSREEIMGRQREYLRYFSPGQYVLDLGCGRGEFLELLSNHGVRAEGVDLNDDMIEFCRERGFTVYKADLFDYLESVEDGTVDGIFLGQVIEHLQPQQLIRLIQMAYAKLKPNGYFIAETPNPRSLSIFAQSFFMDLTHTKPVHPYTAKFLLESEGYREIEIFYISPNHESLRIPELVVHGADSEMLSKFNQTLNIWHDFIFGAQDYYIVGRK